MYSRDLFEGCGADIAIPKHGLGSSFSPMPYSESWTSFSTLRRLLGLPDSLQGLHVLSMTYLPPSQELETHHSSGGFGLTDLSDLHTIHPNPFQTEAKHGISNRPSQNRSLYSFHLSTLPASFQVLYKLSIELFITTSSLVLSHGDPAGGHRHILSFRLCRGPVRYSII